MWACFSVSIPTNRHALLADVFLYSQETDLIQVFLKKNENKLAESFNFMFRLYR